VTLNPDGSPQLTVVWVGLDGDEIVAAHLAEHRKIRNIRNDDRVARRARRPLRWLTASRTCKTLRTRFPQCRSR
jgi:hypothetical protein